MELTGKIIKVFETRSGVSQSTGNSWASQEAVLGIPGQYPKHMVFTIFGEERINRAALFVGMDANVQFDIDAHEYKGRWFNSINAYNVINVGTVTQQPAPQPAQQAAPVVHQQPVTSQQPLLNDAQPADELPF